MKYDAICMSCVRTFEYYRPIAERMAVPACPECKGTDVRKIILSAPQTCVTGKFEPFKSSVDGTIISNGRELAEHNRRNNVCLLGEGYSNDDILNGKIGQQEQKGPDKKEIAQDIYDAIKKCESGYKPIIQSEGAEL